MLRQMSVVPDRPSSERTRRSGEYYLWILVQLPQQTSGAGAAYMPETMSLIREEVVRVYLVE